jgi:hypothetical protein
MFVWHFLSVDLTTRSHVRQITALPAHQDAMNETGRRAVEERRASVCPFCQGERGEPRSVSVSRGIKTIHYVCGACHHHWHQSVPDPDTYKQHDS